MNKASISDKLFDAIENYYAHKPDTLMPLLMLTLATKGNLEIVNSKGERTGKTVFCSLNLDEVMDYEWVILDPSLKKRFTRILANGQKHIMVKGEIAPSLLDIYETFHYYDTYTVEQEYHHRIGILYHHSSNEACEQAHREYATLCLAEALVSTPITWLEEHYLEVGNIILVKSGLQPERPRLEVARALTTLLDYRGEGVVYNPFAGCAFASAMMRVRDHLYADGDTNDKLFAVARLLNYGMGGDNNHFHQRDSLKWIDEKNIDFVVSTYRGYVDGKPAFDFCLSKCFKSLSREGKFAGIISPKDFFEKQSEEIREAFNRDWVDTIVLLPFGEVAVLINAEKPVYLRETVRFYNLNHPMLRHKPIEQVLSDNTFADFFELSDIVKKGFLKSVIIPEIPEKEGFEIVKLGDVVRKMRKQTYSLKSIPKEGRVLAYINHKLNYNEYDTPWMNGIEKKTITSLFIPSYHLTCDCLITNTKGRLEPRLFNADFGDAFFHDGYAFMLNDFHDWEWLIEQLNENYVLHQLHPYGMDEMIPEEITEDQILKLKLYHKAEEPVIDDELLEGSDPNADKLPKGFVLKGDNAEYTIHDFLGHGYFGYTYSALSSNFITGEQKEVVLKEFYPYSYFHRDGIRAALNDEDDIIFIEECRDKFKEEADIMHRLGCLPDSHIVPAHEFFENEETASCYYVMPFYHDGSLDDLQNSGFNFTEEVAIRTIVIPLCKALHIAHKNLVLHLDIKPENILVDEHGEAVLIDFGVAKEYDKNGDVIDNSGATSRSVFAAPELKHGNMVYFGGQTDLFGLAASLFYLLAAPELPHPIYDFSDQDKDLRNDLKNANCSDRFIDAIIAGLQYSATSRPANAQEFLNLFPGCEDIKL